MSKDIIFNSNAFKLPAVPDLKIRPHQAHSVPRIVGGNDTTIQKYPYMSNMEFHVLNIFWVAFCGGSLITPSTILSAAHCYE